MLDWGLVAMVIEQKLIFNGYQGLGMASLV